MMRLLKCVGLVGLVALVGLVGLAAAELPAPRAVGLSLDTNVVLQGSSTNLFRVNSNLVQQAVGVPHVPYVLHGETNSMMPYGLKLTAGSGVTLATNGQDLTITAGSGSVTHTTGALTINTPLLGAGGDDLKSVSVGDFKIALDLETGQDIQAWDLDLDDLADGSLSGAKVGSGIDAANITAGALPAERLVAVLTNTFLLHGETNALMTNGLKLTAGANITLTTNGQSLEIAGAAGSGSGTVTSVAVSVPDVLTVSGSPVTDSGTIALDLAEQSPNTVWAGPAAGAGTEYPAFRALSTNDMPSGVTLDHEWNTALKIYSALGVAEKTGSGKMVFDQGAELGFPTIGSFLNANHIHQGTASGGYLSADAIASGTFSADRLPLGVTRSVATIIVDNTNGDDGTGTRGRLDRPFQTIVAGMAALQSGDVVLVRPGTYTVTPYTASYLEAYQYSAPIVVSNKTDWALIGSPGVIIQGNQHGTIMLVDACDNWRVDGITFKGMGTTLVPSSAYFAALQLYRTNSNFTVSGCSFMDIGEHGIATLWGQRNAAGFRITDNYFTRIGNTNSVLTIDGTAIAVSGRDGLIANNTIVDVLRGIEIEGTSGLGQNITVADNVIRDFWSLGIMVFGNSVDPEAFRRITISGNQIRGAPSTHPAWRYGGFGITWEGNASGIISGNHVSRCVYSGINVYSSRSVDIRDLVIEGNVVDATGDCGIQLIPYPGLINQVMDCVIANNRVNAAATEGGIRVGGINHRVTGNIVTASSGPGITTYTNGLSTTSGIVIEGNTVSTNGTYGIVVAQGSVGTVVRGNTAVGNTSGVLSDSGTGTLLNQWETLGTTANPDIDDALTALGGSISSVGDALSDRFTDPQTWSAQQSFDAAHNNKPETASQTNYTGTTFALDCDGPERVEWEITGDATLSLANVPTAGDRIGIRFQVNATNSQSTNCVFVLDESIVQGTKRAAAVIKAGEFLTTWLDWNGTNFVADWRGDQSDPGPIELGFTGVTTGIAPGGKDVLGDWSTTQTTNHFPDLASGTVFRFPNTLNPYLGAPASRITSSESNSLVITRRIEMLPASEERIIGIDTNYYALQGINQWTTNPAGVPFSATLINWGPDSSNNIMFASVSTNVAAAGGGGAGTGLPAPLFVLEDFSAASTVPDETGNGWAFTSIGGSFTWNQTGPGGTGTSITNNADVSLALTNASPDLQLDGAEPWSATIWLYCGDAPTTFVFGRYDAADSNDRVWALRGNTATWRIAYHTASGTSTGAATDASVAAGWHLVALVYDPETPEIKISSNGGSFDSVVLPAVLTSDTDSPFTIGAAWSTTAPDSGEVPLGIGQVAYFDSVITLDNIQTIYNGGELLPYASW